MATYGYRTAIALGMEPYIMGYGAMGLTKGGNGGTPKAIEAYPYAFQGAKREYESCDYIVINHGANDMYGPIEIYLKEYEKFLDLVRSINPKAQIVVLSTFYGYANKELGEFICSYNESNRCSILYVDSAGWVPPEPLHPLRSGYKVIAEKLTQRLKEEFGL